MTRPPLVFGIPGAVYVRALAELRRTLLAASASCNGVEDFRAYRAAAVRHGATKLHHALAAEGILLGC